MAPLSTSGPGLRRIFVISCKRLFKGLNHIKLPLIRGIHPNSPSTSSTRAPLPPISLNHIFYIDTANISSRCQATIHPILCELSSL